MKKEKKILSKHYSHLLEEWDWSTNEKEGLDPYKLTYGSKKKANWKCKNGHKWKAQICGRTLKKYKCSYCSGRKACKDNCLETTHPNLIKEWSIKNKLKPNEVTAGSHKKIWWKCCKGHEWNSYIYDRAIHQKGCPYCSNQKVCKDNCLATTHPNLIKEWSSKNKIKPTEIVAGSHKKVWWKCKKGHEWQTKIYNRTIDQRGCPICNESKGEKKVSKILDKLNIRHKREYRFKELGQKRFDFAIFKKHKRKPFAVIEYHGEQHYEPVTFGGVSIKKAKENLISCQKRDKIKKEFCKKGKIKFIEIKYTDLYKIEKILRKKLCQIGVL